MKIEKEYKTEFLDAPVGTKMYLVITNRTNTGMFIEEVTYEGYTYNFVQRDYYEPKMVAPVYWSEPEYTVKFKRSSGKGMISFICRESSSAGQRGYDTDEHLECGMDKSLKGIEPSAYGFGFEGWYCLDAYFTTNKEKLARYLKDNAPEVKSFLANAGSAYEKELAKIEAKYKKEKDALDTRFKVYGKVLENLVNAEAKLDINV